MTYEVTDSNIQQLLASAQPVVIDFWAPWCGPCKMMLPIVDELAKQYDGKVIIGKLNVDENPDTCEQYGIMNIPTMLFFKNGELVNRHVGACRKPDLEKIIDALM
ncbi:MAG: thioredoxin [Paludibacteraceae bacterium]|nr:thioredoxin [Paludibacteraceae bacterium]